MLSYFSAVLTGTETSPWAYSFLPDSYGSPTGTMAGVVSPGASGTYTGAFSFNSLDQDTPPVSALSQPPGPYLFPNSEVNSQPAGSITIQPDGSASGSLYETRYRNGAFISGIYTLNQTPVSTPVTPPAGATYDFAQDYHGVMYLNADAPGATSTSIVSQGTGWGLRSGTTSIPGAMPGDLPLPAAYGGWFMASKNAIWTLTSGSESSLPGNFGSAIGVTQMSGRVSGVLGQTLSGNMTFAGSLLGGTSFIYNGPVAIYNDGFLAFNYTGTWLSSGGSGTVTGWMDQNPGYHFTQTVTGNYTLNTSADYRNATFTFTGGSGTSGSRTEVFPGNIAGFGGSFNLSDQSGSSIGSLPPSSSGATTISAEGVVGTSELGATMGFATYTVGSPFNYSIPGGVSLTPNGSFFNTGGIFVSPTVQVNTVTMAQLPLWTFYETYQGFRISTSSTPFNLASIEGYGWGLRTGTMPSGFTVPTGFSALAGASSNLPSSYLGYFVSQDLGTRAFVAATLGNDWRTVTGTLAANLSGPAGGTLSGQAYFTGTTSAGTTFNYNGPVSLSADGRLTFLYYGQFVTAALGTGTGSGAISQVPGTYFSESGSGTFTATATNYSINGGSGTLSVASITDTGGLSGSRTLGGTTTPTTGSVAAGVASQVTTFPANGGSASGTYSLEGVVAGASWATRWGVATGTVPGAGQSISGPVTLDTAGKLTGQFVDEASNPGAPTDKIAVNLVSVPTGSGQTTSSFAQTVSGAFSQTASTDGTTATLTAPSLTGTSTGTQSGSVTGSMTVASTAGSSGTLGNNSGTITANVVGVVGGPTGGLQTGVGAAQMIKTVTAGANLGTFLPRFVGTTAFQPGVAPVLTTTLNSVLNTPPNGAKLTQIGALTTH